MGNSKEHLLVSIGKARFKQISNEPIKFVDDPAANYLLNDIDNYPHAYVLACCMDRQIKAELAWMIPIKLHGILGDFSMKTLSSISLTKYQDIYNEHRLHRFNNLMADVFYKAVQRISSEYDGIASKIWNGNISSAAVVFRFLQFDGVGIKIATMATNNLACGFKVPLSDYYSIDISPDVHVLRVLRRSGLVTLDSSIDSIIYKARELHPEFPGIIDLTCWEIGRKWCRPQITYCENCIIKSECKNAHSAIKIERSK